MAGMMLSLRLRLIGMHDGITPDVRRQCYERDKNACTNPKCIFKDQVETLSDGQTRWKNKHWSEITGEWVMNGLHLHHCFFRSRYGGADRHQPWNLTTLCNGCHDLLHNPHPATVSWSKELEQWCIDLAMSRREEAGMPPMDYAQNHERFEKPKYMSREKRLTHERKKNNKYKEDYAREKKSFMESHGGLTPFQYQYRKKKGIV